jgi:phosphatidylglycerol:prolipoprotein diacylglycerol transferase
MWYTILHIYGPIAIHGYGLMIAIGLLLFIHLMQRDPRFQKLNLEPYFISILMVGIIAGLFGGRLLFFISYPEYYQNLLDFFLFFNGGFSILGCILGILFVLPFYLYYARIPIIPLLDLVALYTPLLQSISRIGCFLAGCCYGLPTDMPWGITYTQADTIAPTHICLHPTQLYSSISLMIIFALLYFVIQHYFRKKGQILCWYILLVGAERFVVDFWRGDRDTVQFFSINQYIAASMIVGAFVGLCITTIINKNEHI